MSEQSLPFDGGVRTDLGKNYSSFFGRMLNALVDRSRLYPDDRIDYQHGALGSCSHLAASQVPASQTHPIYWDFKPW